MSDEHKTTRCTWTLRVRRGPDDEVIVTLGDVDHVMSERQAEELGDMIRACCQGVLDDSGSVKT